MIEMLIEMEELACGQVSLLMRGAYLALAIKQSYNNRYIDGVR